MRPGSVGLAKRALADLNDLENILLDTEIGNDDDEDDTKIQEYNALMPVKKNYRRRNYMLGHMARMNFRRRSHGGRVTYGGGQR